MSKERKQSLVGVKESEREHSLVMLLDAYLDAKVKFAFFIFSHFAVLGSCFTEFCFECG